MGSAREDPYSLEGVALELGASLQLQHDGDLTSENDSPEHPAPAVADADAVTWADVEDPPPPPPSYGRASIL
jgi:hypothetical protein